MARRAIERCGLEPALASRLRDKGVSALSDLMTASPLLLSVCLDISVRDAERIQQQAALTFAQQAGRSRTALEMLQLRAQQDVFLATGIPPLDEALSGGLHMGTITEISGAPGVGKTQFCIGCCVEAITRSHPSLVRGASWAGSRRGTVVYIDTEHKFDPQRLGEVAAQRFPAVYSNDIDGGEMGRLLEVRAGPPEWKTCQLAPTHPPSSIK